VVLNRRVAVALPAYNAAKTLERTCAEIPHDVVDDVILIDDASTDATDIVFMLHLGSSVKSEAGNGDGVDSRFATV
jgi:hypothetical protein